MFGNLKLYSESSTGFVPNDKLLLHREINTTLKNYKFNYFQFMMQNHLLFRAKVEIVPFFLFIDATCHVFKPKFYSVLKALT